MRKKKWFLRLFNKIRIIVINSNKSVIYTQGKVLLSPKTELSIQGTFNLGNGVVSEKNTFLAVREDGVLNIGSDTYINRNVCIVAREAIYIGERVDIGPNVCIYDHDHNSNCATGFKTAPIEIGDHVWVGSNSTILKGVKIGRNSVIGAGSVIVHDIPENSVVCQKRQNTISLR